MRPMDVERSPATGERSRPEADRLTETLFEDPRQRAARLALLQDWRDAGLHGIDTIAGAARRAARDQPDVKLVTTSPGATRDLRLADLWAGVRRIAAGLRAIGVGPGDRVAVQLPNGPEAYLSYVAVSAVGGCLVPIAQIYGPTDTQRILARSQATTFIVSARAGRPDSLDWLATGTGARNVVVVGVGQGGTHRWPDLEEAGEIDEPVGESDWPAALLYTSGTTGEPKGVLHTSNSILGHLQVMPCPSFGFTGTFLWSWPSGHIGGILAALSPVARRIDTVLLGEGWDTTFLLDAVRRFEVRGMSGVPTVGLRMLDAAEAGGASLPIREFFTGGASIPPAFVDRAEAHGWHVTRSYGSTENPVVTATARTDNTAARRETEGAAVRGTRVRFVRDDGTECEPGEDGELVLVAPQQMLGYELPAHNAEAFTADGWLRTGDIGHADKHGCLVITDRKKDIIIRGGENISSREVEDVLLEIPAVTEAAVVAMPDRDLGERACAFLILSPGTHVDLVTVRAHFSRRGLAVQKCPERVEVVDDMPRTSTGKILKNVLRDELRSAMTS